MKHLIVSVFAAGSLFVLPALAQTATEQTAPSSAPSSSPATSDAPMMTDVAPADGAPDVVIVVPDGYLLTELVSVTADELKGVDIFDPEGNKIAEIADVAIGADDKVTGIITDVGGFLGMGEHRVSLSPSQVAVYKNPDNDLRAYVSMSKDELKALPTYVAPNP